MAHLFNEHGLCTEPEAVSYEGNDCEVRFFVAEQNQGYSWGYQLKTACNHIYVWPHKMNVVSTKAQALSNADRDAREFLGKMEGWGRPWIAELNAGLAELRKLSGSTYQLEPAPIIEKPKKTEIKRLIPGQQLSLF